MSDDVIKELAQARKVIEYYYECESKMEWDSPAETYLGKRMSERQMDERWKDNEWLKEKLKEVATFLGYTYTTRDDEIVIMCHPEELAKLLKEITRS